MVTNVTYPHADILTFTVFESRYQNHALPVFIYYTCYPIHMDPRALEWYGSLRSVRLGEDKLGYIKGYGKVTLVTHILPTLYDTLL